MENLKPVRGYEGKYTVSDCGRIFNRSGKEIGQWLNNQGYALVRLSQPRKVARVHRLVAEAYIENPDSLPFVNHKNCIRNSNHKDNLEWCTQWQNINHSNNMGRMVKDYWIGKRSPSAKLTDQQAASIRCEYSLGGVSHSYLANKYGTNKKTVGGIVNNKTYQPLPAPPVQAGAVQVKGE